MAVVQCQNTTPRQSPVESSGLLSLKNITCEIDERVLFAGISVEYSAGDLVQIVGPNGAGKTTLLKVLTGLSSRYEGELRWCDKPIPSYEFYSSLLYIGHLPGVKSSLTPLENLSWYFGLNGKKSAAQAADQVTVSRDSLMAALARVGLAGYENVPSFHMSAGQQRRVALARLYISEAPLWILDEPFTAIDKAGVAALEIRLEEHRRRGGMVVLTTHQSMLHAEPKILDLAHYLDLAHHVEGRP